ncbi:MAG TPA: dihydroorotate dehydrogenase-like protein [Vicinamibacterales bacterium]|nr:dihydroorotate dehydrogenase-like protein [Vicinamibacterales bacterium]
MDTTTSYLGLRLAHPFIAGASPMGYNLDTIKRLEDAGCAAVVLHSLFEEQISLATEGRVAHVDALDPRFANIVADYPPPKDYKFGPDGYAQHLARVKAAVGIPVIASLNGHTGESWLKFAQIIEQAGADALEFNYYDIATDLTVPAAAVEDALVTAVGNLTRTIRIPVAVKLTPFYTSFGNLAAALDAAGASGLVLFNRFYQSDVRTRTMTLEPQAELSTSAELPLRLHWLALLHGRVRPSLAVSGGVATPDDGIKALLAGADAVQIVSAILRHGPGHIAAMRQGLERWLEWQHIETVSQMVGRAGLQASPDPAAFERAHYIRTLQSWTR